MQEWFSILELVGCTGLPKNRRAILYRANNEAWQSRERQGRGGGLEYHISSLPKETQQALAIKAVNERRQELAQSEAGRIGAQEGARLRLQAETTKEVQQNRRLEDLVKSEGLQGMARDRMNSKLEIIKLWEAYKASSTEGTTAAQFAFASAYNRDEIKPPDWVKPFVPTISQPTLMRWLKLYRQQGLTCLAGRYGNKAGTGIIDTNEPLRELVLAMIHDFPHCDAKKVWMAIKARAEKMHLERIPSVKTIDRWMSGWKSKNIQLYTHIESPDKFKSKFGVAFGSADADVIRYLQRWQMDGTPTDIMLADGRHTINGVIDVYSRRAKVLVSKTSKAVSVAALIRRAIIDWGVPECIKTDNGADYTAKYMVEVLRSLEIEHAVCLPFTPEQKPHIERFFRTLSHGLFELCQGFVGHNVAERQALRDRNSFAERLCKKSDQPLDISFMTAAEVQKFCDSWIDSIYETSEHKGINQSPAQIFADWVNSGKPIRRITDVRARDYRLAEVPDGGIRTVPKNCIRVARVEFIADELYAYVGSKVFVRYDLFDQGKVLVFNERFEYIATAINTNLLGAQRIEVAAKAKAEQKKQITEQRRELKKISSKAGLRGIAGEIIDSYAKTGKLEPERSENSIEYTTPAIEAATTAAIVNEVMNDDSVVEKSEISPDAERKLAEIVSLEARRKTDEEREQEAKKWRIARYEALPRRKFQGNYRREDMWRRSWEQTPECRTYERMKKLAEENRQAIKAN
jgi:hypothetical protein